MSANQPCCFSSNTQDASNIICQVKPVSRGKLDSENWLLSLILISTILMVDALFISTGRAWWIIRARYLQALIVARQYTLVSCRFLQKTLQNCHSGRLWSFPQFETVYMLLKTDFARH